MPHNAPGNQTAKVSQSFNSRTCSQTRKRRAWFDPASGLTAATARIAECPYPRGWPQQHAVPLFRLPGYFSVKTGTVMHKSLVPLRKWGLRHIHAFNQPQGRIVHEAPSRHRRDAEDRLAHAPAHPQGVGR